MRIALKVFLFIILSGLVIGLVVVGWWYFVGRVKPAPSDNPAMIKIDPSQEQESVTISRCVGTIEAINGKVLSLKAEKTRNPFGEDRSFEFTITDKTRALLSATSQAFVTKSDRIVYVVTQDEYQEGNNNQGTRQIDLSQVQKVDVNTITVGDSVIIVADRDLKTNNSAIAEQVFLIK